MKKIAYEKEYRPPSLDIVWDSGTVDKVPDLLHQCYGIIIGYGPSVFAISACQILYVGRDKSLSPNPIILRARRKFGICKLLATQGSFWQW
jgi:hypothetical protein